MRILIAIGVVLVVAFILVVSPLGFLFTVDETEFAVVTRFGDIQRSERTPGLKVKLPFVEQITKFDNRLLRVDVRTESMPDRESQFLEIDAYVRYRIVDARKFWTRLRDEVTAAGRIGNIVISEIREAVASTERADVIGGESAQLEDGTIIVVAKKTPEGSDTRTALMERVRDRSDANVKAPDKDWGVEIVDVKIKRADFPPAVEQTIFNRMRTERDVQAKRFRAEGEEENLTITANVDREVTIIRANADRESNQLRGEGEAEAISIFASALGRDPEFFAFRRSLETYTKTLTQNTTVVLSSENDLFQYLESPGVPSSDEISLPPLPELPPPPIEPTPTGG
jgi:membrane protease subunit HflC